MERGKIDKLISERKITQILLRSRKNELKRNIQSQQKYINLHF